MEAVSSSLSFMLSMMVMYRRTLAWLSFSWPVGSGGDVWVDKCYLTG